MSAIRAAALAVTAVAAPAAATTFSFASDFASSQFTFEDGAANAVPVDLLIDDENGVFSTLSIKAEFSGRFALSSLVESVEVMPGLFVHNYWVRSPFFDFKGDLDGDGVFTDTLMTVSASDAAQTVLGTSDTWGSSGGIFGGPGSNGSAVRAVTYSVEQTLIDYIDTELGANAADYGLFAGDSIDNSADFAFTLTNIQPDPILGAPGPLGLDSLGRPDRPWVSEGSFSGTARFIPAPAAAAMLLGGFGLTSRRRRSHN
ncbi:MAG: hypothetical protein AAGB51_07325 [Planctomycetota bacterium]